MTGDATRTGRDLSDITGDDDFRGSRGEGLDVTVDQDLNLLILAGNPLAIDDDISTDDRDGVTSVDLPVHTDDIRFIRLRKQFPQFTEHSGTHRLASYRMP